MPDKEDICVIGMGYIGLPTAAFLADRGHSVVGVDVSKNVVETINNGNVHIQESGLDTIVKNMTLLGRLKVELKPTFADFFSYVFQPRLGITMGPQSLIYPRLKKLSVALWSFSNQVIV